MADLTVNGPAGPKPKKRFSRANIFLYGTLIMVSMYYLLPLYVMIVTSVKGMPEIRLGNVFSPPMEVTFDAWRKAAFEACTGIIGIMHKRPKQKIIVEGGGDVIS